jgi:hypothetical protein
MALSADFSVSRMGTFEKFSVLVYTDARASVGIRDYVGRNMNNEAESVFGFEFLEITLGAALNRTPDQSRKRDSWIEAPRDKEEKHHTAQVCTHS